MAENSKIKVLGGGGGLSRLWLHCKLDEVKICQGCSLGDVVMQHQSQTSA